MFARQKMFIGSTGQLSHDAKLQCIVNSLHTMNYYDHDYVLGVLILSCGCVTQKGMYFQQV